LPAASARERSCGRICVVPASKKTVSSLSASAISRFVPQRAMPWAFASASILTALRPIRIGSGHHGVAVGERHAALCADRADRADEVLVHAHPAGDAVHDETESSSRHGVCFQ